MTLTLEPPATLEADDTAKTLRLRETAERHHRAADAALARGDRLAATEAFNDFCDACDALMDRYSDEPESLTRKQAAFWASARSMSLSSRFMS